MDSITREEQEMVVTKMTPTPMPPVVVALPNKQHDDDVDDTSEGEEYDNEVDHLQHDEQQQPPPSRRSNNNNKNRAAATAVLIGCVAVIVVGVVLKQKSNNNNKSSAAIDTASHERSGKLSSARVLFGLHEGYSDDETNGGKTHSLQDAQNIIVEWMQNRTARNEPVVAGALRTETLIYPHGPQDVLTESAAVYEAHVRAEHQYINDPNQILDLLRNLTEAICVPLQQVVCFYEYLNVEYKWTNPQFASISPPPG